MSEVRNWCCETEGLTSQEVQDYLDYAVSKGAKAREKLEDTTSLFNYIYEECSATYDLFGVDSDGDTALYNMDSSFSNRRTELKPFQIKHFIDTGEILKEPKELPEEMAEELVKEVTDELCEVLEQPLNNQDLLFYITEALLRPDEVTYTERRN